MNSTLSQLPLSDRYIQGQEQEKKCSLALEARVSAEYSLLPTPTEFWPH
jgi:hypothetical protein